MPHRLLGRGVISPLACRGKAPHKDHSLRRQALHGEPTRAQRLSSPENSPYLFWGLSPLRVGGSTGRVCSSQTGTMEFTSATNEGGGRGQHRCWCLSTTCSYRGWGATAGWGWGSSLDQPPNPHNYPVVKFAIQGTKTENGAESKEGGCSL